jgi:hypothetical protein
MPDSKAMLSDIQKALNKGKTPLDKTQENREEHVGLEVVTLSDRIQVLRSNNNNNEITREAFLVGTPDFQGGGGFPGGGPPGGFPEGGFPGGGGLPGGGGFPGGGDQTFKAAEIPGVGNPVAMLRARPSRENAATAQAKRSGGTSGHDHQPEKRRFSTEQTAGFSDS